MAIPSPPMDAENTSLTPGRRIELRKQIAWLMAEDTTAEANLTLEEFGLPFPDDWGTASKKGVVLGLTSKAPGDTLVELTKYLLERGTQVESDSSNTPFDAGEQAEIAAWAADLEQNAAERYDLTEEQQKDLVGELRELVAASGRVGRNDWYKAAVGSIVTLTMSKVLSSPITQQVLEGMVSTLGHLFGHPIPQLGPGPIF